MRQETRQIREAQERGEFDDLPGKGQPLDLAGNPYAPGSRVGLQVDSFKILKESA